MSGRTSGNVLLRRAQHAALDKPEATLLIARHFVAGKLQNARHVLMRSAREANSDGDRLALTNAAKVQAEAIKTTEQVQDLEKLRGIEGFAAKSYFAAFTSMIRTERDLYVTH